MRPLRLLWCVSLFPSLLSAQPAFTWQHPLPQGNNLTGVEYAGDGRFVAVGAGETALISTDFGTTWFVQSNILGTVSTLFGPSIVGDIVYAIGVQGYFDSDGGLAKSTDGGLTWTDLPVSGMDYASISFGTEDFGFYAGGFAGLFRTTNGGASWEHLDATSTGPYEGIDCLNETRALIVTSMGILLTTDGGNSWAEQILGGVTDVEFVTESIAYAVGSEIIKSTDGGSTWITQRSGTVLSDLSFISAHVGYTVGGTGTVLKTTDGGGTWSDAGFSSTEAITGVAFASADTGVVVGNNGTIYQTLDGGETWIVIDYSVTNQPMYGIAFGDSLSAVAVGGDGTIARTTNGGGDWLLVQPVVSVDLYGVTFSNAMNGVAVGDSGAILHTSDGGLTWSLRSGPTTFNLRDVCSVDSSRMMAVGLNRTILVSSDAGLTWKTGGDPGVGSNYSGIAFGSKLIGGIVGDGSYLLRTTDGGVSWVHMTVGGNAAVLNDVAFLSPNRIVAVGFSDFIMGPFGIAVTSSDTGMSWTQQAVGRALYDVSSASASEALAGGSAGSGYETTDAGVSWHGLLTGLGKDKAVGDIAHEMSSGRTIIVGTGGSIVGSSSGMPPQEAPILLVPEEGEVLTTPLVVLQWEQLPFVQTYMVQVSTDTAFVDPIVDSRVLGEEFVFDVPANGPYHWRVSAYNSAGNGPWTAHRSFVLDVGVPHEPLLSEPDDSETLKGMQVILSWSMTASARDYSVEVASDSLFATVLVDVSGILDTSYVFDAPVNGTFYWHVRGANIAGEGPWSETRSFVVASLLPAPVALWNPADSAVVLATSLRFTWLGPDDEISRYWFELSNDQGFSSAFIDSTLADTAVTLTTIELGRDYWWRVRAENFAGWGPFQMRQFRTYETEVPMNFVLEQNYPNPFNGSTIIRFGVPHATTVSLTLFDVLGRRVQIVFNGIVEAGIHEISLEASQFATGIYWFELTGEGFRDRRKLMIVR